MGVHLAGQMVTTVPSPVATLSACLLFLAVASASELRGGSEPYDLKKLLQNANFGLAGNFPFSQGAGFASPVVRPPRCPIAHRVQMPALPLQLYRTQ